jgi:hypothetical protein
MLNLGTDLTTQKTLHLSLDALRRHVYLCGATGTGKTTLLDSFMHSLFQTKFGFCFIDPHGDKAEEIADAVPEHRLNDIIYFDPSELSYTISYNPLAAIPLDDRHLAASQILAVFIQVWKLNLESTPRLQPMLYNALRLLLDTSGSTLLDISRLLHDEKYRIGLINGCEDGYVRDYWETTFMGWDKRYRDDAVAAVDNRIGVFATDPILRSVVGQPNSTLSLSAVMDRGQILICNLSKGRMGDETSHMLGALVTVGLTQAMQKRAATPETDRLDFTLLIDEFQNFVTPSFATVLAEARKYRLSLVLANQLLNQIPEFVREAILGTANTKIVFRCGPTDAGTLAPEFGLHTPVVNDDSPAFAYCEKGLHTPQVLTEMPNYQAWVRTIEDGRVCQPAQVVTQPSAPRQGRLPGIRAHTRSHYARSRAQVEALLHPGAVRQRTRARDARPRRVVEERVQKFLDS